MLYQIVRKFPDDILFEQEGPFISLYIPTNRHAPENKQDPIVYKNLLKNDRGLACTCICFKRCERKHERLTPDRGRYGIMEQHA